jgi:hypothetical protein
VDITFSFGKDKDPGSAGTLIAIGKKKTKEERTKEQLCTSHLGLFYFLWLYAEIKWFCGYDPEHRQCLSPPRF